jgi:predicted small lipoprotein YifL
MARPLRTLLLGLVLLAGPACGRKGPLELPPGREPMPVENLTASLGHASVLVMWKNPVKAVSGKPVGPLEAVEVWVFDQGLPSGGRALTSDEVEKTARLARRISRPEFDSFAFASGGSPGVLAYTFPVVPGPSGPAKLAFTVRVFDAKGRASDFAAPVAVDGARKDAGVDRPAAEGVS